MNIPTEITLTMTVEARASVLVVLREKISEMDYEIYRLDTLCKHGRFLKENYLSMKEKQMKRDILQQSVNQLWECYHARPDEKGRNSDPGPVEGTIGP
jgi:hypothetical protein